MDVSSSLSLGTSTILSSIVSVRTSLLWCLVHCVLIGLFHCRCFLSPKRYIYFSTVNLLYLPISSVSVVDFLVCLFEISLCYFLCSACCLPSGRVFSAFAPSRASVPLWDIRCSGVSLICAIFVLSRAPISVFFVFSCFPNLCCFCSVSCPH